MCRRRVVRQPSTQCPRAPPPLQVTLFFTTGVCLPWISLLFGGLVLVLAQVQRLGGHPALIKVVQPVLTGVAVATTLLKLELLRHAEQRVSAAEASAAALRQLASSAYLSGAWRLGSQRRDCLLPPCCPVIAVPPSFTPSLPQTM